MGLIQDVGGKLVQSFLSLDDLVLGQGLVSEGLSQLGLSGRSVAGTMVIGTNVAARTINAGVQVGAKTAKATAGALEGFVPGAGLARSLAERVDQQAATAAEEASVRATHAVEMTGGEVPRSPLNQEEWMAKSAPRGYSWSEIAADTAVGSFGGLAMLPLTTGIDMVMTLASTAAGRMAIDSSLKSVGMMLDMLPGTGSTKLDGGEIRESLMAVTASSGDAAARNVAGLAEAAVRISLGDTRKLRETLEAAVEAMRLLAEHQDLADLMPAVPISALLRRRARNVVDHTPTQLLKALERGPDGEAPTPGPILSAMLDDAENLRIFVTDYPLALTLMSTNTSLMLAAGMADVNKIEAFVGDDASKPEASRPWSATQLEAYVGNAPGGAFFDASARAAQDTVFTYSAEVLGREKALERAARLYGAEARERLENDISLYLDILRAKDDNEREQKIRQHIGSFEQDGAMSSLCDHCQEQLESLETFSDSIHGYAPKNLTARMDALRTFLSLAGQDLALRGTEDPARGQREAALNDLLGA